ncbi:nitronate monooxygenase [Tistlia consotensis]|uniref:Nitronate monooxygenase n=1 Tax=Tistlia consotensis USBA 355 TaxID=560819 RepID=A0A1Y6BDT7_9PROT|nr:nitronate monooxygenase [Tistlia consotensis]SME98353.1 nitronate monooxygenase [Tistlia consotensis USBA 355]SNR57708.1 nitronate monooxygenase [Tistlia consotensis]
MPRLTTALTELLGIEHPILLAPMAKISGGRLAAAVSEAGGLGLLGGGYAEADWIDPAFRDAGNGRIGIGFITWALDARPDSLTRALAHRPAAVMLSFGDPAPYAPAIKQAGATLICQVQRLDEAQRAVALGADVIVAQGQDAGGHGRLGRGTLAFVRAAAEALPVPVVAAGGIGDGRGLAAALMLGAAGVLMGTRFYAAEEAIAPAPVKQALVEGRGDDTVFGGVFDRLRGPAWPAPFAGRSLANALTERWGGREQELVGDLLEAERAAYRAADQAGDMGRKVVWAGEVVDMIERSDPAATIVRRTVAEAVEALSGAARFLTA